MADPFVKQLLCLWKMESLIDKFTVEEIDQHAFECLNEELIAQLIVPIGKRAIFLKKFGEYKQCNVSVLDVSPPPSIGTENIILEMEVLPTIADEEEIPSFDEVFTMEISSSSLNVDGTSGPDMGGTDMGVLAGSAKQRTSGTKSATTTMDLISFPAPLPNFSSKLQKYICDGTLLMHSNKFVQECGNFLLGLNSKPSKKDYVNYCLTIVNKYPQFRDHSGAPEASMKKRITAFIRNHRHYDKKSTKKHAGSTACGGFQPTPAGSAYSSPSKVHAELKEKHGGNVAHTRLLMKNSHSARRTWIMKQAISAKEILEKFPHLKTYSLLMYEFQLLELNEVPEQDFDLILKNIGILMKESPCSEPEQISMLANAEKKLQGKRAASYPPAIDIQVAGGSVDILRGNPVYPVLRVFSQGSTLNDAYVVVEGMVLTKIDGAITTWKCVKLLLATYYVLDISYPGQYCRFLSFLGEVLLAQDPKSTGIGYTKFMQQYRSLQYRSPFDFWCHV